MLVLHSDMSLPVMRSCVDSFTTCAVPARRQHLAGCTLYDMNAQYHPIVSFDGICLIKSISAILILSPTKYQYNCIQTSSLIPQGATYHL